MRESRYKIPVQIYNAEITLIISPDIDRTANRLCPTGEGVTAIDENQDGIFEAYFIYKHKDYSIIVKPNATITAMGHEALHATFHILRDSDVKYHHNNQEPFCYLHGYILEQIHARIKRYKRK